MKLPNAGRAIINRRKLCEYLLSPSHFHGRHKAAFFSKLGYTVAEWGQFEADIRRFHLSQDVVSVAESGYGTKYEISGPMTGPNGRTAQVVTVWIVEKGGRVPRLVTAFPGEQL